MREFVSAGGELIIHGVILPKDSPTPQLIMLALVSLHYNLPIADSIILATAKAYNCIIWTQDADFKDISGVKYFPRQQTQV